MPLTTNPMEGRSQSSGQHQRLSIITSTLQLVMFGVMDVSSLRYGLLDTSHFMITLIQRSVLYVGVSPGFIEACVLVFESGLP